MILFGDIYSVYTRTVRMVLHAKFVTYRLEEMDPFDSETLDEVTEVHPFTRVPVLELDDFKLYETQAILDYLEALVPKPILRPIDLESAARMRQVMSIADSYFYWPLVRQAVVQHVFNPLQGDPVDEVELDEGLDAAPQVLDALEALAEEGRVLVPGQMTLACCHLWPMMDYALMVPEIADMLGRRPHLADWADRMAAQEAAEATKPDMEALKVDG